MKETLTLLERCQREAREKIQDFDFEQIWSDKGAENLNVLIDTLIANTLKQAAEVLPTRWTNSASLEKRMKVQGEPSQEWMNGYNQALTDAQRLLLGEDNEN